LKRKRRPTKISLAKRITAGGTRGKINASEVYGEVI
jgi:hypothetical protein